MRILILGGAGMLGHRLWIDCSHRHSTVVTLRGNSNFELPCSKQSSIVIPNFDLSNISQINRLIVSSKPDVVVNCAAVLRKQDESNLANAIEINATLPHRLAEMCEEVNARLIHISSDAVFSGRKGNYIENDKTDPVDAYGWMKCLSELNYKSCVTIRCSIIGHQLTGVPAILEWFLQNPAVEIKGYSDYWFSGVTTNYLSQAILHIIEKLNDLQGIIHISSEPINKFQLLSIINDVYQTGKRIVPVESEKIDRTLNSDKFASLSNLKTPDWQSMSLMMRQMG